jgi:hypothetical protein
MPAHGPSGWQVRFFPIWIGQAFSMVGSALVRYALIWTLDSARPFLQPTTENSVLGMGASVSASGGRRWIEEGLW